MHGLEKRFVEYGGGLGEAQMDWLRQQLQVSTFSLEMLFKDLRYSKLQSPP
jgi:hypothetical protein